MSSSPRNRPACQESQIFINHLDTIFRLRTYKLQNYKSFILCTLSNISRSTYRTHTCVSWAVQQPNAWVNTQCSHPYHRGLRRCLCNRLDKICRNRRLIAVSGTSPWLSVSMMTSQDCVGLDAIICRLRHDTELHRAARNDAGGYRQRPI